MANKKLTTRLKIKPGPIHKLKTIKRSMNPRLIRPQTQHKNPENTYLKFLTPLLPSVEKNMNLHAFK